MNRSFDDFKTALRETNKIFVPLLEKSWLALLGLLFFSEVMGEYFKITESLGAQLDSLRLISQLGQAMVDLCVSVLLLLIVPVHIMQLRGLTKKSPWAYGTEFFWPLTVEGFRYIAAVLLWGLLVIPGLIKYFRYSFFPFIVMFDPEAPKIDVLKKSELLAKGVTRWLVLIAVLTLVLQLLFSQIHYGTTYSGAPIKLAFLALIAMVIEVYIYALTFELYWVRVRASKGGMENEPHI